MKQLRRFRMRVLTTAALGAMFLAFAGSVLAQGAPTTELRVGQILRLVEDRFRFLGGVTSYETNIFETLVRLHPDMTTGPGLATSWEATGDTSWRFRLREGVTFHSGRAFDADSAKLSLETSVRELSLGGLTRIAAVTVVDPYTIDIETTMPFAGLPEALSHPITAIGNVDQEGTVRPDGTGPFRYVSHIVDAELVVERFDGYWGEPAKVGRVVFLTIPDAVTRLLALRTGSIDVMQSVPFGSIDVLERQAGFQTHRVLAPSVQAVWFNRTKAPADDVLVRRAVAHAVDRQAIVDFVLLGIGEPAPAHIPPLIPWSIHDETDGYAFDAERSRQLLDEAGWSAVGADGIRTKDGERLVIEMTLQALDPQEMPVAEVIQAMLKRVGIDLTLHVLERGAYFDARDRGVYHASIGRNIIASASAEFLLHGVHSTSSNNRLAPVLYIGPEVDALIDRAAGTFQEAERYDLYRQIQRVWADEVISVPLYYVVSVDASRSTVAGYQMHATAWSQRWDGVEMGR